MKTLNAIAVASIALSHFVACDSAEANIINFDGSSGSVNLNNIGLGYIPVDQWGTITGDSYSVTGVLPAFSQITFKYSFTYAGDYEFDSAIYGYYTGTNNIFRSATNGLGTSSNAVIIDGDYGNINLKPGFIPVSAYSFDNGRIATITLINDTNNITNINSGNGSGPLYGGSLPAFYAVSPINAVPSTRITSYVCRRPSGLIFILPPSQTVGQASGDCLKFLTFKC